MPRDNRGSMNNRGNSNTDKKADGFLNVNFIPERVLNDTSIPEEEVIKGDLLKAKGVPLYISNPKDEKVMEYVVAPLYAKIQKYLDEDTSHTVDDANCPKLTIVREMVINVYDKALHERYFGMSGGIQEDDKFV